MKYRDKKNNLRAKTDRQIKHISLPFDFKHHLHVGQSSNLEERAGMDDRPISPPAPCPGNKDKISGANISQVVKDEIFSALRLEIADIVEEKIRKVLDEQNEILRTHHCKTCRCNKNEQPCNDDSASIPDSDFSLKENPKPCAAIFVEDNDTGEVKVSDVQAIERRKTLLKSFSNPVYHQKGQTLVIQTQHGAKLVKCGSRNTHALDETLAGDNNSLISHSKSTMCRQHLEIYTNGLHNHKDKFLSESDERDCLAFALQWHISELVDGILFKDSELPDILLADGCITEDECAGLRSKLDRKDQVRVLLSLIKGRDVSILKKFLIHIKSHNEKLAESIEERFVQNKKEGRSCTKCALCKLTSQVNLKYIVDDLWKNYLVDDGLFNLIVQTDRPTGAQDELWYGVIHSLNTYCQQSPSDVLNTLGNALKKKNHYNHLAHLVEQMIYTNGVLECRCHLHNKIVPFEIFSSVISSISTRSSSSEFETDLQLSDIGHLKQVVEASDRNQTVFVCKEGLQDNILCCGCHSGTTVPNSTFDRHRFQDHFIPKKSENLAEAIKPYSETDKPMQENIEGGNPMNTAETTSELQRKEFSDDEIKMFKENNYFVKPPNPLKAESGLKPASVNKPVPLRRISVPRQRAIYIDELEIADL